MLELMLLQIHLHCMLIRSLCMQRCIKYALRMLFLLYIEIRSLIHACACFTTLRCIQVQCYALGPILALDRLATARTRRCQQTRHNCAHDAL